MRILVTGAGGFVGKNLLLRCREAGHEVLAATRSTTPDGLADMVERAEAVVHLAGANRPESDSEFALVNDQLTADLCALIEKRRTPVPVIAASTSQFDRDTPYGRSKKAGEDHLRRLGEQTGAPVAIYRLVNVFGKWCRPNYNSVVATFCHNIARDLPIRIDNPDAVLRLVHVDDVIDCWFQWLASPGAGVQILEAKPEYTVKLGELEAKLRSYRSVRESHTVGDTGTGFGRALYATYISYLPVESFAYPVTRHSDKRGVFVEMLRTEASGQFSFFTAEPGVTRGGHYHHAKTEKFLVLKGHAKFRFLNLDTGQTYAVETRGEESTVVETIPGWSHDITNIGEGELICMLWANELFDRGRPDTIAYPLSDAVK